MLTEMVSKLQLRGLLQKLKRRCGLNDVYQSHKSDIPLSTMAQFLSFAHDNHLTRDFPGSELPKGPIVDINQIGTERLAEDALNGSLERFHWPMTGGYEGNEDDQEDNEQHEMDDELMAWVSGE